MAPKWLTEDKGSELQDIIQKLTTSGKQILDEKEMKKLKNICKSSDDYVNVAYYSLMTQLRKDHAEIRYSALLIINELFMRSCVFRSKLEADLDEFLALVEETDPERPLPLPLPVAKKLRMKGIEFIKNWAAKFGERYIRLGLAVNYLQQCRKVDFNDLEARTAVEQRRQQQEEARRERVMKEKVDKVKAEMEEFAGEMNSLALQMENCFELLIPSVADNLFTADDFESSENSASLKASEDNSSVCSSSEDKLRHHGFHDMKKTITIEIQKNTEIAVDSNEDTLPIIDNLKDLEKQFRSRYYPMVTRWLKVLSKGSNCSDLLKRAIDLKSLMEEKFMKFKELKINPSKSKGDSDDEDDDDFEEVQEKEGYEETVKNTPNVASQPSCSTSSIIDKSNQWKMKHHRDDVNDPTTALSNIHKRLKKIEPDKGNSDSKSVSGEIEQKKDKKSELLEKAPVLPYDIDLYHWEEEKPLVPEVVRYDSLHKFWETKDDDELDNEVLKEAQIASLRTRKIDFSGKFEPVKWTCRAPLPNGKLCPRQDRYKCPFHGKIIPRDPLGNPSGDPGSIPGPSKESSDSVPDWQDPQLLKEIEAATGIDLKVPDKKSKGKRKKKDGLTNLKQINNTVRNRLMKKILKRYHHYARKLDEMERKRFNDKFGDQWNYF